MGELLLNDSLAKLVARNRITADDVLDLRRTVYADGVVSRGEAEALFAMDNSCRNRDDVWDEFFVEAVSDYLVMQEAPVGYVSQDNAAWLIRAISRDNRVETRTELELLVKVMEKASSMPAELSAFALRQVAHAVINGEGAYAKGRQVRAGVITADDVAMLRRVLYAFGGDGQLMVTRAEAEVLFDLNDRTVEAANDPAWSDLFTKAIGFSLLAAAGVAMPSHDEALAREAWLNDVDTDLGGVFSSMFAGGLRGVFDAMNQSTGVENAFKVRNDDIAQKNAAAENIDMSEAQWLSSRIGRDGVLHENERALLAFIKAEARDIHPDLMPLFGRVA